MCKKIFFTLFFLLSGSFLNNALSIEKVPGDDKAEIDDIIVEKNLFHPERKKWEMKKKKSKSNKKPGKKKKVLSKIELFGTIMDGDKRCALLRTKKGRSKNENRVYTVGDYIGGYCIKEIERKKVVLKDETTNEDFIVYINEGKKDRAAAKTEIREESPRLTKKTATAKGKTKSTDRKIKRKAPNPKKAKTADFLRKRLQKHVKILKRKKSRLVKRQAEKDYKKLEELLPYMAPEDRRQALDLKKELDGLGD